MIHVIATIELNPGTREAFLEEFRKLVPLVRAEAGTPTPLLFTGKALFLLVDENGRVTSFLEGAPEQGAFYAYIGQPAEAAANQRR